MAATRQATRRGRTPKRSGQKPRPPGGPKRSRAQVTNYLNLVAERLTRGVPRYEIVEELKAAGIPRSTTDRYIDQVHGRWKADAAFAEPHVRAQRIARVTMLSEETRALGKYTATAQFERMLNEMQGVNAPLVVQLPPGALQPPPAAPVDLRLLADNILDALEQAADERARGVPQVAPAGLLVESTKVIEP